MSIHITTTAAPAAISEHYSLREVEVVLSKLGALVHQASAMDSSGHDGLERAILGDVIDQGYALLTRMTIGRSDLASYAATILGVYSDAGEARGQH